MIDVIIPTYNNQQYLNPCLVSMMKTKAYFQGYLNIHVVNNGSQPVRDHFGRFRNFNIIDTGDNLGWEGGLKRGLEYCEGDFVVFQNDDVLIPPSQKLFYDYLIHPFNDSNIGAVGPTSTVVSGMQSIFNPQCPEFLTQAPWLIGFCMCLKRSILDEIGGVDNTLPGGDDFDISIRLKKANKKMVINPNAFLIHHGFKTGERLRGTPDTELGWNSTEMIDRTNQGLIRKHGFKEFISCMFGHGLEGLENANTGDKEGDLVRKWITGDAIAELGCGEKKTVENAIGIDRIPKGCKIPNLEGALSVADIVSDCSKIDVEDNRFDTTIARHVFEHCLNSVKTLKEWKRITKPGGRIIICMPNEGIIDSIPLNPEHVHAFTPETLRDLCDLIGLKHIHSQSCENGVSFMGVYENA